MERYSKESMVVPSTRTPARGPVKVWCSRLPAQWAGVVCPVIPSRRLGFQDTQTRTSLGDISFVIHTHAHMHMHTLPWQTQFENEARTIIPLEGSHTLAQFVSCLLNCYVLAKHIFLILEMKFGPLNLWRATVDGRN